MKNTHIRISRRIRAIRESRQMTQTELAELMGLKHRQIIASIEAGERAVQPEELVRAAQVLRVDLAELTDPFRLVGEGRFSFRASDDVPGAVLDRFQDQAGRWIATLRTLQSEAGIPRPRIGQKLELTPASSFEDAHEAAEQVRGELKLGDVPAEALPEAIEREFQAQVLFVDAPSGLSGAAIQLPGLNTILVNRREPEGRRNFDLAHELFHLLTWDAMAPDRVEPRDATPNRGKRVERLADNFAGALLMPEPTVTRYWSGRPTDQDLPDWLNATATRLRVSALALKWRLVVLNHLSVSAAKAVDDLRLANNGGLARDVTPPAFNRAFVTRVYHAVEDGRLSLRKAADLLGLGLQGFADLCRGYGLEPSYEI